MKIRKGEMGDLKQITEILSEISELHYQGRTDIFKEKDLKQNEKNAMDAIKNDERNVIVAIDNMDKICGILIYRIKEIKEHINLKDSKILWIEEIGVEENSKRKGIGKQLIKETERIAKEQHCKRIELNCWNFNQDAIEFYKAIGMQTQRQIMEKKNLLF